LVRLASVEERRAASLVSFVILVRADGDEATEWSRMAIGFAGANRDYARSWRDLRRRERAFWIVVLSYVPGVGVAIMAVHLIRHDVPEYFAPWVGGGWLATYVIATFYRRSFRCPRCQHFFLGRTMDRGDSAQSCAHCELPRESPQDPDAHSP
jgi:hypothetical protein